MTTETRQHMTWKLHDDQSDVRLIFFGPDKKKFNKMTQKIPNRIIPSPAVMGTLSTLKDIATDIAAKYASELSS